MMWRKTTVYFCIIIATDGTVKDSDYSVTFHMKWSTFTASSYQYQQTQ